MLQKLSEQVRACHERAAEAKQRAEATTDIAFKADLLDMEKRWLALARSYAFTETLGDFTAAVSHNLQRPHDIVRRKWVRPRLTVKSGCSGGPSNLVVDAASARRRTEALLREGEKRLRQLASIVEFGDDAIISENLEGIITSWNRGAERLYGFAAEEAVGKPVTILIPRDRQDEEPAILARIRRGERVEPYDAIRRHKSGTPIEISLTVSPLKDLQGNIVGASHIARDITERKRSEARVSALAREAEHRSKNVLATVQATVRLSRADTPDGLRRAIEGRIQALANVHALFSRSRWVGAELSSLVTQELAPYRRNGEARVQIDGPNILLDPSTAQAIAVTLHELATNAAKYGALSVSEGRVQVAWSRSAEGRFVLRWIESGGPSVNTPTRQGFGMRVIEWMIRDQRKGDLLLDWRAEGLDCEIALDPRDAG